VALALGYEACAPVLNPGYAASPVMTSTRTKLAGGEADTVAVYFSDNVELTPQFKLVGGVRYDNYAATITNSVNRTNTTGNTAFARLSQTVNFASVRAGATWQPTKRQSCYISYSTSFNPSLEQLTSTTGLTQTLPPQTNADHVVGGKWHLLDDQLDLTEAAFQITQSNSRSQNTDNTYSATGVIQVRGARLGVAGRLTRHWKLLGGYAHLDARIIDAIAPGTVGRVPANTPCDAATVWTTYEICRHWEVGGGGAYLSQRYLNNTDLVRAPGYVRWDATLAWRQPNYEVRLNLFNLADARF
jgi:catecholate siderophore receptor